MPNPIVRRRILFRQLATGSSLDPDAAAFIAFGIVTDPVIQDAINTLTISMKDALLWDKCQCIYPYVTGAYSATGHNTWGLNLKDVSQFSIAWTGGVTFNANGITGDGATGYGDTGFNSRSNTVQDDFHMSFYCRSNLSADQYDFGASDADGRAWINSSYPGFNAIYDCNNSTENSGRIFVANGGSQGYFICSRNTSNQMKLYKNTTTLYTTSGANSGLFPNLNFYMLNINLNGTPYAAGWSSKNYAFTTIGSKLTDADALAMNTIVQAFQTSLSRNV